MAAGRKYGWSIFAAEKSLVTQQLAGRRGHFMPASLLQSQLDTLEEPVSEDPLIVDLGPPPDQIAGEIIRLLSATAVIRQM